MGAPGGPGGPLQQPRPVDTVFLDNSLEKGPLVENTHLNFNVVTGVFRFVSGRRGVGPENLDFGPLPGPTRPRRGLGKAPAGALLDLHRFSARTIFRGLAAATPKINPNVVLI